MAALTTSPAKAADPGTSSSIHDRPRHRSLGEYNVFCPECSSAPDADGPTGPGESPDGVSLVHPGEVETTLPLTLVATMEAEPPGLSVATISRDDGATGLYAEGDELMDGVELLAVDTGIVHLRAAGRFEFLRLASENAERTKKKKKKKTDKEAKKKTPKKSKYEIDGARDAIKCEGERCTIERAFVAQLMQNPALLTRQARARPYSREGLEGIRLSRVRRGTIPRLLGLRTGDVITGINGRALDSVDGAMAMYQRLRNSSHLSIDYTRSRKGERHAMHLEVDII